MVQRSRVLFLPQTSCDPEKRLLSVTNHREQVALVTKNEGLKENCGKEKEAEEETRMEKKRRERKECGKDVKRKKWKSPLDDVVVARPETDLFYFVFPKIRTLKFRENTGEGRRNA